MLSKRFFSPYLRNSESGFFMQSMSMPMSLPKQSQLLHILRKMSHTSNFASANCAMYFLSESPQSQQALKILLLVSLMMNGGNNLICTIYHSKIGYQAVSELIFIFVRIHAAMVK